MKTSIQKLALIALAAVTVGLLPSCTTYDNSADNGHNGPPGAYHQEGPPTGYYQRPGRPIPRPMPPPQGGGYDERRGDPRMMYGQPSHEGPSRQQRDPFLKAREAGNDESGYRLAGVYRVKRSRATGQIIEDVGFVPADSPNFNVPKRKIRGPEESIYFNRDDNGPTNLQHEAPSHLSREQVARLMEQRKARGAQGPTGPSTSPAAPYAAPTPPPAPRRVTSAPADVVGDIELEEPDLGPVDQ